MGPPYYRPPLSISGRMGPTLLVTYADGKQKFYVNGELVGEVDSQPTLNTKQEFLIGAGANERANHEYLFKGIIDEVRVYNLCIE